MYIKMVYTVIRSREDKLNDEAAPRPAKGGEKEKHEMTRIETSMYRFTAGKLPKGYGRWAFGTKTAYETLFIKGVNPATGLWFIYGAYAQARKSAIQKAKEEGIEGTIYVLP